MSGTVAINDAGDVLTLQNGEWRPATVAQNGRGERLYLDGNEWRPLPAGQSPARQAINAAGEAVSGAAGAVAEVPGSWWGRRARDVAEGLASFPSAAVDAMFPGVAYARGQAGRPGLSQAVTAGADAIGLPRPTTDGERMTSAVVQGVVGAIPTMGIGAGTGLAQRGVNMLSQAVGGGTGGAAAETAAQAGYGPAVQTLAGVVGGLGGAGAVQGTAAAGRALPAMAQPFSQAGRERMAADALLQASSDPQNLAQRIGAGLNDPNARLPTSPVTTAQAARDPGLLGVEASVRDGALGVPQAIPLRDQAFARNESQRGAIAQMQDGSTPAERGVAVRTALRGSGERDASGRPLAGDIGARQALAARTNQLYGQVDPQGTLQIPTDPVRATIADQTRRFFDPDRGGAEMPAQLRSVLDTFDRAGPIMNFEFAQGIRRQLGEIAGKAAASGDTALASAAGSIRGAIDDIGMNPAWQRANEQRADVGRLLGRDESGANVTGQILRRDQYGQPIMADAAVPNAAIRTPAAVNQVMEAQYRALADGRRARLPADQMETLHNRVVQARQALRGQFIDDLMNEVTTNTTRVNSAGAAGRPLSSAWFQEFWDQRSPVAAMLFERPQMRRLELLARDFAESSIGANAGRTANSQTIQNMTVGNMVARVTNGLIDPETAFGATASRPLRWLYQEPERMTREILGQAMADPRFAALLLARANPTNLRRATDYVEQNMAGRLQGAAVTAVTRQAIRSGAEEERRQAQ